MSNPNNAVTGILKKIYGEKSAYWNKMRALSGLNVFHSSADGVKAYQGFLKMAGISPTAIVAASDLKKVPAVNKDNYLRAYPLDELCRAGSLRRRSVVFTSTSGSTGAPFYFPRENAVDLRSSVYHEIFLRNALIDADRSTLVIVCFGMGVWIGGIITYQAFKMISDRGYRLAILTPGVNKNEIFAALKNIAPRYDQVVICGYPPFLKDIVDEAAAEGVDWKKFNVKMVFAAEAFSEQFREYVAARVGIKNLYRDTMNVYGSADLGTMAAETPVSILARRIALGNAALYNGLFKEASRLPTLAQFHPAFVNFDEENGRIFCTGDNVLPLVRYEIGDNGGVIGFDEVERLFAAQGLSLKAEVEKAGLTDTLTELPFVYVYERSDLSVKLYGAIVYPEHVKAGLQDRSFVARITGKFAMAVRFDANQDEYLEINIELAPNESGSELLAAEMSASILRSLTEKSAEYKNNASVFAGRVRPRIVFWPHGDPTHFKGGAKQKWVVK